jgi:penicillin-binding protein 1B
MVLGSMEVTPLEVAVAFSTIANQGIRVTPLAIKRVVNQDGETLERRTVQVEQVIPPEDAYMLTHLLEGVLERGTAKSAREHGFARPAAGKTGTTNDFGDAWFVGYTPDLVAVVWVGFDHRESLDLSGGQAALPIWTEFMKRATTGQPGTCFSLAPGIVLRPSGRTAEDAETRYCPTLKEEAFYEADGPIQSVSRPETIPIGVSSPSDSSAMPQTEMEGETFPAESSSPGPGHAPEGRPWWRLF